MATTTILSSKLHGECFYKQLRRCKQQWFHWFENDQMYWIRTLRCFSWHPYTWRACLGPINCNAPSSQSKLIAVSRVLVENNQNRRYLSSPSLFWWSWSSFAVIKSCPCTNFHNPQTVCLSRFDALTSIPLSYLDLLVYLVSSGPFSGRGSSIEMPWYILVSAVHFSTLSW